MIHRFPLAPLFFLALWSLCFALPQTRPYAMRDWKRVWSPPDPNASGRPSLADFSTRDAQIGRAIGDGDKGRSFRELGRSYPNDAAICAGQLAYSAAALHLNRTRQAGPASNSNANWSVKIAKIERPSPKFLNDWFAATSRGAKLEPNNTFWDWMQMMGLMAARRDDEVWPLLRAAKSKTAYDDHQNDLSAAYLRELRRQNGPLPPMQELNTIFLTNFPAYGEMRDTARQLSEDAWGLRLQNTPQSHKKALEGMRDFIVFCRTARLENKTIIGSLVAEATESIGLWGGGFKAGSGIRHHTRLGANLSVYASDPHSLFFWANARGRKDIASQAGSEWVALGKWSAKTRGTIVWGSIEGVDGRDLTLAWAGDWWRSQLLVGMPLALGLVALASLLLRLVPALRHQRDVPLSQASWIWGAAIGFWSVALLSSALLWEVFAALRAPGVSLSNVIMMMPQSATSNTAPFPEAPRAWQLEFPTALLLLGALWQGAGWDARQRGEPSLMTRLRKLFEAPDDGLARFDVSPLVALIIRLGAVGLATMGILAFLIVPALNENWAELWSYAGLALLLVTFIAALPTLWRIKTARGRVFALLLARRFAWSASLSLSLAWAALTLATRPVHQRFEAQIDRYLRIGEFQLARRRLGF